MTEQELRALVRQAIARHAGSSTLVPSHPAPSHPHFAPPHLAPSHWLFAVRSGADEEGPCIIEPAVMCNHCGYCKSMGH
jgi:hypothetical protein